MSFFVFCLRLKAGRLPKGVPRNCLFSVDFLKYTFCVLCMQEIDLKKNMDEKELEIYAKNNDGGQIQKVWTSSERFKGRTSSKKLRTFSISVVYFNQLLCWFSQAICRRTHPGYSIWQQLSLEEQGDLDLLYLSAAFRLNHDRSWNPICHFLFRWSYFRCVKQSTPVEDLACERRKIWPVSKTLFLLWVAPEARLFLMN